MTEPTLLEDIEALWHRTALVISYCNADDSGGDWKYSAALKPLLLELERQIIRMGGDAPTGEYLLDYGMRVGEAA